MENLKTFRDVIGPGESAIVVHHKLDTGKIEGLHFRPGRATGWTEKWKTNPVKKRPDHIIVLRQISKRSHDCEVLAGRYAGHEIAEAEGKRKWRYYFAELVSVGQTTSLWREFINGGTSLGSDYVVQQGISALDRQATSTQRVLFARIGDMRLYRGISDNDEGPSGAGRYNEDKIGHECYNFGEVDGRCYGYVQPKVKKGGNILESTIALHRIQPGFAGEALSGVTVIFFTKLKKAPPVIVGWYKNATVFRSVQLPSAGLETRRPDPNGGKYGCLFDLEVAAGNAVLLPQASRPLLYNGGGARHEKPGQSNVFYIYDGKRGQSYDLSHPDNAWIGRAVALTESYDGPNLVETPGADAFQEITSLLESIAEDAAGKGQKFARDAKFRKAVENHAMEMAKKHFKNGFEVKDVSLKKSYDLECTPKSGRGKVLRVEVKGTTSGGESVFLTANEVKSARSHQPSALFIVHSITVEKTGQDYKTKGGKVALWHPWEPAKNALEALIYKYTPDYESRNKDAK